MTGKVALYGADGFGREVLQFVKRQKNWKSIVFVDDNLSKQGQRLDGIAVVSFEDALREGFSFAVAIADPAIRQKLVNKIKLGGGTLQTLIADSALISDTAVIGEGAIISDNVIITANCMIGVSFHANIFSYVAHDCVVGDYVTLAPRVSCNGRVTIGDHAYIGTSAVIKQGSHSNPTRIGERAIVGMGAVVTKNVEPQTVVVGNPARLLAR